jgi:small nuclear ribonucleoprotein B and B'
MSVSKGSKMLQFVNYRMRVTLDDSRVLVGRFMAFDSHMNLVLADCEEFRRTKKRDVSEKRALGLVLLRGECVVSLSVESPPPPAQKTKAPRPAGRGVVLPAGRGAPLGRDSGIAGPAPGLAGPVPGVGMAPGSMQPQFAAAPQMYQQAPPPGYGRGMPPMGGGMPQMGGGMQQMGGGMQQMGGGMPQMSGGIPQMAPHMAPPGWGRGGPPAHLQQQQQRLPHPPAYGRGAPQQ